MPRKYTPNMVRQVGTRLYESREEAIKSAKTRAKTNYCSQFIYSSEAGYYVRSKEIQGLKWVCKVKFDGSVETWPTEKEQEKSPA